MITNESKNALRIAATKMKVKDMITKSTRMKVKTSYELCH